MCIQHILHRKRVILINKPLFLLVGKSASGKTTVAEYLEKAKGMKLVQSYSTRLPRYEGETGHIFVTDEEFDKLENIIGYTEYHGHRYCSTKEQLDEADIYVVDPPGVETLLERYKKEDRTICIIYFSARLRTRIERMNNRGDAAVNIVGRLYNDSEYSWWDEIERIYNHYKSIKGNNDVNLDLCCIDANQDFDSVIKNVIDVVNQLGG